MRRWSRARGQKNTDQNHMPGLADRAWFGTPLLWLSLPVNDPRIVLRATPRVEQSAAQRQFLSPCPVGQKAKLTDAHESSGQDVEQKAPDELHASSVMIFVLLPSA
jgi:hypothetical protein